VFEELRRIVVEIEMPELNRFQVLRKKINEVMQTLLDNCLKPTNTMVKNLVTVQNAYINTYHPDFMGGANSVFNMFDPAQEGSKSTETPKERRLRVESMDEVEEAETES
jgi:dynamin 1-like protein